MTEKELFHAVHQYANKAEVGAVDLVFADMPKTRAKLLEAIREWAADPEVGMSVDAYNKLRAKAAALDDIRMYFDKYDPHAGEPITNKDHARDFADVCSVIFEEFDAANEAKP